MKVEDAFLEAYMDSLETIIYAIEYMGDEFFNYYDYAMDSLDGTVYDAITQKQAKLSILIGLEEMKNSEYSLAVIDHCRLEGSSIFDIVETIYPGYLQYMSYTDITVQDFELFCKDFDSIMNTIGHLIWKIPFL